MRVPKYPSLYQVNTRVWLTELSRGLGRPATLDDIPDVALDRFAAQGFDWIWLLSVWQTGAAGQRVSRGNAEWRREFQGILADLCEDDIAGSGFAIQSYSVPDVLGGDAALARLRQRLRQRGLRLMLDFVPNHTALDHPWVEEHPDYYVAGTEYDLQRAPHDFTWVKCRGDDLLLAHGRDPFFPGWPDTLQLNYANPALQEAVTCLLEKIALQCDGLRCDMAMLVLPDVFQQTWGVAAPPFWPTAIGRVRQRNPHFCFLAEVYWDLEWTLQQQGFDYTYDKRHYDRLREGRARPVREHLWADLAYQDRLARFLENHDEPRIAATLPLAMHKAAAIITYLTPGLRFFHQGQLEGYRKRILPHLCRGPCETVDETLRAFYDQLLTVLRDSTVRDGRWQSLSCEPTWDGNWTVDCFVAFAWQGLGDERLLVIVNFASHQSQCRVRLPLADLAGSHWRLDDRMSEGVYQRDGNELVAHGLFVDMSPWQAAVFQMTRLP
jgi:hypothetical protein